MKNPNDDILLRIAQGDAYCVAVEFIKSKELTDEALKFERYLAHPRYNIGSGNYTDDTAMSIGVAECITKYGVTVRPIDFAKSWVEIFHRDYRDGYARGFQNFLRKTYTGSDFLKNILPHSEKNGAAMRSVPLGVIPDVKEMLVLTEEQANITHNTLIGRWGAVATALMSHWALYHAEKDFEECYAFMYSHLKLEYMGLADELLMKPWTKNRRILSTTDTVNAVFTSISSAQNLTDVLKYHLQCGGDTDSSASIAMGIASSLPWIKNDLPLFFETELEMGNAYGVPFLKELGRELMSRYST